MNLTLTGDVFYISPYFFSCFVALREKELPFEVKTLALHTREQDKDGYPIRTLTGRIPSLTHDDIVIAESSAIVEYLEEAFPKTKHIFPTVATERARARQIMSWLRSDDTLALRDERSTHTIFYAHTNKPLSDAAKRSVEKLFAMCDRLLGERTDGVFDTWTLVDAELAFMLQRLIANGDPVPANLKAFVDGQWKRKSIQEFVDRKRPEYVAY
ncbi:MAG: glutathione transferase [Sandaracinaceae bacterium]|jgi:glutathione S-transferase|nr:glutathione transferase [Sandaracinaceae bacterium]